MASNCSKMVVFDNLYMADNPRSEECMAIPAMVESYKRNGLNVDRPIVLSEKPDGRFLVLRGNRRTTGLLALREQDAETFAHCVPSGKVPAIVHKGLTVEEEVELRIDHTPDLDRVPLDEWSIFSAIKQLVNAGYDTQERIAIKLGIRKTTGKNKGQPAREFVQVRVNLARLPGFVQDEIRKLTLNRDDTPVRWGDIAKLYKVYNEEYVEHDAGDGPKFSALWATIMTPEEVPEDSGEPNSKPDPKELSPAEAVKRSQSASSPSLKQALLVVTRQSDSDLAAIDAHLVKAESALQTLADIKAYLGEKDFAELVDTAIKQAAALVDTDQQEATDQPEEATVEA